jgi:hypothetical protein
MVLREATMEQLRSEYQRLHAERGDARSNIRAQEVTIDNLDFEMQQIAAEVLRRVDHATRIQQSAT